MTTGSLKLLAAAALVSVLSACAAQSYGGAAPPINIGPRDGHSDPVHPGNLSGAQSAFNMATINGGRG